MKHKNIYNLLKTLNIPVAYDHLQDNKTINPPFIVYRESSIDTFKADNKTFYRPYNFEIEVITTIKDVELQEQIEELLDNNNIPYDTTTEIWDEEEKIYHNFYEI